MTDWRSPLVSWLRKEAQPPEKFSHQPRLYALACQLAEGAGADDDVLFAAAYLHDLGVFYGHRPEDLEELKRWDNTLYAMQQSPAILKQFGFPAEKIPAVIACIETHQPHATPRSLEAALLRDADILEQLGSIGALRTICKIGRDTRFATFADAVASLQKAVETLPTQLQLPQSEPLARPRVAILRQFLENAQNESSGELA